jgi:hypothetical protein
VNLQDTINEVAKGLLEDGIRVSVPTWQALDVSNKPQGATVELMNFCLDLGIPDNIEELQAKIRPNLPWAEEHFQERVSGIPYNPPPSAANWPFTQGKHKEHTQVSRAAEGQFSHTYPERFWPKQAGRYVDHAIPVAGGKTNIGIRYEYGDLLDVVNLLARQPTTRQAYLPVFFPEDTGAVHGQRIPCSIGYQFLMREDKLNVLYTIRSCDLLRHFADDVYMACRLGQWVREACEQHEGPELEWVDVEMGRLFMHIGSLHVFEGDLPNLRRKAGYVAR